MYIFFVYPVVVDGGVWVRGPQKAALVATVYCCWYGVGSSHEIYFVDLRSGCVQYSTHKARSYGDGLISTGLSFPSFGIAVPLDERKISWCELRCASRKNKLRRFATNGMSWSEVWCRVKRSVHHLSCGGSPVTPVDMGRASCLCYNKTLVLILYALP